MLEDIQVLIYKESPGLLIAQCIQYDIAAQASNIQSLGHEFKRMFFGQIAVEIENGNESLKHVPKAPNFFWKMYDQGYRRNPRCFQQERLEIKSGSQAAKVWSFTFSIREIQTTQI